MINAAKAIAAIASSLALVATAQSAVLSGQGQVTASDGSVLGTIEASVDTDESVTYCLGFGVDPDTGMTTCTGGERTVSGALTLNFVGDDLRVLRDIGQSAQFFVDPDLGPGSLLESSSNDPLSPRFFFSTREFALGDMNGASGQGFLTIGEFLGGTITGAVVAASAGGSVDGTYTLSFPGLTMDAVPLPAGALLFLSGLGAVGIVRKRG